MTNPVGQPLKFKTVEILRKKIDGYFKECDLEENPYTVCGLAYHLDITRETLVQYGRKEGYSDTIKKAKLKIEVYLERKLLTSQSVAGLIFNLKNNFGWKDKQEIDQNITVSGQLDSRLIEGRQAVREKLEREKNENSKD